MNEHFIETRQLRYLIMLARHRNFSKAADALFITQPALTKSIRNLEHQLDITLFDRKSQSVDPTPQCEVLLQHAHRVIQELENARHSLDAMSTELSGMLNLGSGPVVARDAVSTAAAGLLAKHPRVSLKITIESFAMLASLLREGHIHLFVADVEELRNQPDLAIIPLAPVHSVYVCSPDHPLVGEPSILPEHLLQYPLAFPALPPRYRQWLFDHAPGGMDPAAFFEAACRVSCESLTVLKTMATNTMLITAAPRNQLERELASGELVEIPFDGFSDLEIRPGIVYLKDTTLPPVAEALIRELLDNDAPDDS